MSAREKRALRWLLRHARAVGIPTLAVPTLPTRAALTLRIPGVAAAAVAAVTALG